jgi:hypothetical protein
VASSTDSRCRRVTVDTQLTLSHQSPSEGDLDQKDE